MADIAGELISQPLLEDFVNSAKLLLPFCEVTNGYASLPEHTLPDSSVAVVMIPEKEPQDDEYGEYCLKHIMREARYGRETKTENYYSVMMQQRSDGVHYEDFNPVTHYEKGEYGKWHVISSPLTLAMKRARELRAKGKTQEAEAAREESIDLFRQYSEMQLLIGSTLMERYLGAMSILEKLRGAFDAT